MGLVGLPKQWGAVTPPVGARINHGHPLAIDIIGCWLLEEGGGLTAFDISGYNNHGTLNGPIWRPGQNGMALQFDAINDVVDAGSNPILDDVPALTWVVWMFPETAGEASVGRILDKSTGAGPVNGYTWFTQNTATCQFGVDYTSTNLVRLASNNSLVFNRWQQMAVTWDGSATAANVHIYINGNEVRYTTTTDGTGTRVSDGSAGLTIGNLAGGTAATFDGLIESVVMYRRALSQQEIQWLYVDPYAFMIPQSPRLRDVGAFVAGAAPVFTATFRKTLSPVGTGVGRRQTIGV